MRDWFERKRLARLAGEIGLTVGELAAMDAGQVEDLMTISEAVQDCLEAMSDARENHA